MLFYICVATGQCRINFKLKLHLHLPRLPGRSAGTSFASRAPVQHYLEDL